MFRTEINIPENEKKIGLDQPILTLGSCFSDTIGEKLHSNKFRISSNPLGTIFNPLSIFHLIETCLSGKGITKDELVENQEVYYHYDFHSELSDPSPEKLVIFINSKIREVGELLTKTDWLVLTFGTAFIYELKSTGAVVSNCHKIPANQFNKKLLSTKSILKAFDHLYSLLKAINPSLEIILTLSPVRHIKDNPELNQVSKSTLRIASHFIKASYPNITYFPGYEILLDDLRDYRFYDLDMVHPSEMAVQYIWEKFGACFFDNETINFIKKWGKLRQAMNHKPFHPESKKHQAFLKNTLDQIENLAEQADVSREIKWLQSQIKE